MFRQVESGFLSVLYSIGEKPLEMWHQKVENGIIKRIVDPDIESQVIEIRSYSSKFTENYISAPIRGSLGIKLPFMVMQVKGISSHFSFEVQILDDTQTKRTFRSSTIHSNARIKPLLTCLPLKLSGLKEKITRTTGKDDALVHTDWNQIPIDLAVLTMKAYGTKYVETQRIKISADCRIRRLFFCETACTDVQIPKQFRLVKVESVKEHLYM
ncbi:Cilia- and flagella-associated protein 20/CFAP20DC like protein [Aduncisulcus paluster]|uniref:Cilia- and flagella-associated protein 20/CFAP20DC like protein n=1 Tax=Aduncisulcus paluster TaxID=2918883 RepID=A0ABQ5KW25_9EUKA|nr:Cilia- and flagella-associated protein 20/CFAP20DC like protein [Aduncisulcus paluster]